MSTDFWSGFVGTTASALSIAGVIWAVWQTLKRKGPAKRISFSRMKDKAIELAPHVARFNPTIMVALSLRGAVVAHILSGQLRAYLGRTVPTLVAQQYFPQDGVDPRVFDRLRDAPQHLDPTTSSEIALARGTRGLAWPGELLNALCDREWTGRLLIVGGSDSGATTEALGLLAKCLSSERTYAIGDQTWSAACLSDGRQQRRFVNDAIRRTLRETIGDPLANDLIVALGLEATPAANQVAQYVSRTWKVYVPTVVCFDIGTGEAQASAMKVNSWSPSHASIAPRRFRSPRQRRRAMSRTQWIDARVSSAPRLADPVSTNVSTTLLPIDLERLLVHRLPGHANILLVDDYTASGSMFSLVANAIAASGAVRRDRIATLSIAYRASGDGGRDRDNGITVFKGIPVYQLVRAAAQEVTFPWDRK